MNLWFDLKYAWRLMTKSWGYSLMCASVVALSVGLAVWTYSLAYGQLMRPLAFPGSERWYSIQIGAKAASTPTPSVDAYTYQELLANTRSADHLGAYASRAVVLSEGVASRSLRAAAITPRLLAATRVAPAHGRTFDDTDGRPEAAPVAILSHDAWQRYFAGDPTIVGRTARIDAAPVQIVGVMPKDFFLFRDFEVWTPLDLPRLARPQDSDLTVSPLMALRDGQSVDAVRSEMQAVVKRVNGEHPDLFHTARRVVPIPAHRMFSHSLAPVVVMLSFMSAAVLLLGCVNISMVFFSRLLERSRELALRTALGSSRGRLMRQCLLETALVVAVGLVVGYGLAAMGVRWTQALDEFSSRVLATGQEPNSLILRPIHLLAAVLCATIVWLFSTLIPAWRIARQDAAILLAGTGKGVSVRASNKSVALLVGLQVVVSCIVLVIGGNAVLAVKEEVSRPTGLRTAGVMISTAPSVFDGRYSEPAQRLRYWEDLAAAIENRIPGATVAFATAAPTMPPSVPVVIETRQGTANDGTLRLPLVAVSEKYFELMGLTLRSGRLFDSTDNLESLDVAVIDEKVAARYWPEGGAVGKRVQLKQADGGPWLTILGVVSGVAARPFQPGDSGVIYRPLRQAVPAEFHLLTRLPNATGDHVAAARAAAFAVDRDLPLHNPQLLDEYLAAVNLAGTALIPVLIVVGVITALLAATGLFGIINRSVAQRTQEVGIRRALGATPWRATSMFTLQGAVYLGVAMVAVLVGIMALPLLSGAIPNILDRVIVATLGVVLLTAAVIFSASYFPTRRAVALEPGDALRYD